MLTRLDLHWWQSDHLLFNDRGAANGKKTRKYDVLSRKSRELLGQIRWFTSWRKYVFYPMNCILDSSCMRQISDFSDLINEKQKMGWKPPNPRFIKRKPMIDSSEVYRSQEEKCPTLSNN